MVASPSPQVDASEGAGGPPTHPGPPADPLLSELKSWAGAARAAGRLGMQTAVKTGTAVQLTADATCGCIGV